MMAQDCLLPATIARQPWCERRPAHEDRQHQAAAAAPI